MNIISYEEEAWIHLAQVSDKIADTYERRATASKQDNFFTFTD
jgi:hypothetical protein